MNKVDFVDDPELLELVEMEIRELLTSTVLMVITHQSFKGSATGAFAGEAKWVAKVDELMDAVDTTFHYLHARLINHSWWVLRTYSQSLVVVQLLPVVLKEVKLK